jgi:membrane protease subunit HflK
MYVDAMQQIYSNTTKVLVDSKQGSNLMYLPLDKLTQMGAQGANVGAPADAPPASVAGATPPQSSLVAPGSNDSRARDGRSRDRDAR